MIHPHFSLPLVEFFAAHRNPLLTQIFRLASFFGSATFYVILTILLYVLWDKRFAIRLSVLVLFAMACNDLLKLFIRNPRPFIAQGTWQKNWAVSPAQANVLAQEFSTPSGHAMGSSAFYSYLAAFAKKRSTRVALVILILLIGVSRTYLGVHYVEDVLLGWAIGLAISFTALRYLDRLGCLWAKCSHPIQIALTLALSIAIFFTAVALNRGRIDGQVQDIIAYCGFLTGIVIACPLEIRLINFVPRSSTMPAKLLRSALSIFLLLVVLFGLKAAFRPIAPTQSFLGCALEFLRYVAADFVAMFLAPALFCKLKLAAKTGFPQTPIPTP